VKNSKAYEKAETSVTAIGDMAALVGENTQVNVLFSCILIILNLLKKPLQTSSEHHTYKINYYFYSDSK